MAKFRKVDPRIWNDEGFRSLSDDGKLVFLFILTHPHQTALGAMRASVSGLADELGWLPGRLREAFDMASGKGMLEANEKACFIALPKFLDYNVPESPNVIRAWQSALDLIPECKEKSLVVSRACKCADGLSPEFGKALPKAFRSLAEALPQAMPNQEQEPKPISPLPPKPATKPEADPPIPPVLRFAKFWKDEYEFAGHGMYHWTPKDAVVAEGLISSFGVPDENPDLAERVRMFMADQDDYVRRRRQTWIFETRVNDYKPGKSERSAVPSVEETKATIARISKPGKPVMPPGKTG